MILVDTAPLVSLIDAGQGNSHTTRNRIFQTLRQPLLTTWCSLTEAMYLLHRFQGWSLQQRLWQFVQRKALYLHTPGAWERDRIYQLMEQYQNVPMDLADASLVAAAEVLGIQQIFTLDSDFHIYRLHGNQTLIVTNGKGSKMAFLQGHLVEKCRGAYLSLAIAALIGAGVLRR